ncbi:DMT family transporter [Ammoniphilus sp. CFH 90114]|uniref:DMT family transporter n=1 Tax=Ammoniphilus sp. CFH 90114 TaxID=2493665 RepID=UPI00100F8788|nr:DMT family transporter [Ammoniphilus sp. CFH 90114]RXT01917.1 DMT family transporter [Ammoniphilus sp. CFH 90114]
MQGILFSLMAGVFICLQSVFNANASMKIGLWQTNVIVHGLGFIVSLLIFMIIRDGSLSQLQDVNKLYLLGGAFGVLIIFSVMKGITFLGAAYAVAIILISQLLLAFFIDSFGWFGVEKMPLTTNKIMGIVIMIVGILVFQYK